MLSLFALVTAATTTGSVAPDDWKAFYNDGQCMVGRTGVPSSDAVEIRTITWDIVYNYFRIAVLAPVADTGFNGKGQPTYETDAGRITVPKTSFTTQKLRDNRVQIDVTMSDSWAKSASFEGLGLNTSDGVKRVSPDGLARAKQILDICRQEYLQKLGIDPAEVEYSFTRAKPSPNPSVWFDYNDLPRSNGTPAPYRPFVIWRVGADARASRCQLVTSSGKPELDAAICSSFMKRVRYDKPAFDQQGNAIASWQGRRIVIEY